MKAIFVNGTQTISLVPRNYPLLSDNLVLTLRNEFTDELITPNFTFEINQLLKLNLNVILKENQKFEIELKNGNEIIYLGKLIVLKNGINTQNYEYKQQANSRFI